MSPHADLGPRDDQWVTEPPGGLRLTTTPEGCSVAVCGRLDRGLAQTLWRVVNALDCSVTIELAGVSHADLGALLTLVDAIEGATSSPGRRVRLRTCPLAERLETLARHPA
jgi:ABC-type transporter Mla MlaB component